MFRFESIFYLAALMLLPVFFVLFYVHLRKWRKMTSSQSRILKHLLSNFSINKAWARYLLSMFCFAFMVIALARPQMGVGQSQIKSEGVELMLLVDVSQSMNAEDIRPSRMEHAKKSIMRLLDALGGDKVGLVAFAGSSALQSPLTNDKNALKMFVESLNSDSVSDKGTEIATALGVARDAFKRGGEESDEVSRVTKVILLISDGEDHEKGAIKTAKDLTEEGIRIFTMAVGTAEGGKIPKRDARGRLRGYLKSNGEEVLSKVEGEFLKELATAGEGSFYHIRFDGNQILNLKEDLSRLEKAEFETIVAASYDEKYQWLLLLAIVAGIIELGIGNRKKISKVWKGRFPA